MRYQDNVVLPQRQGKKTIDKILEMTSCTDGRPVIHIYTCTHTHTYTQREKERIHKKINFDLYISYYTQNSTGGVL